MLMEYFYKNVELTLPLAQLGQDPGLFLLFFILNCLDCTKETQV
jgi:hypothetical protein